MKWISLIITALLEIAILWLIPFMHNFSAIIGFLVIALFIIWIFQESREDMEPRPKSILSGCMLGTYAAAIFISLLAYSGNLPN